MSTASMKSGTTCAERIRKMKKILVLFKTHLDVGFTDYSRNVVEKYNKI